MLSFFFFFCAWQHSGVLRYKCCVLLNNVTWISQINPTRCTILFNIVIYLFSLHVSGIHVPIIRRKLLHLCDTGICHCVWVGSDLLVGLPADQTPPIQSDEYQCCIDTAIFSWWWAHGCPKHVEKLNKYIKQNCAPSWTYLQDYATVLLTLIPKSVSSD